MITSLEITAINDAIASDYNEYLDATGSTQKEAQDESSTVMQAQVITFKHGTCTIREVVLREIELRNGATHYITLSAYGNRKALLRRVPSTQRHIESIDNVDVPYLEDFLKVADLIREWRDANRTILETFETYGVGHDGNDTVYHGDVNIQYPSADDIAVVKRLYSRQAELAAIIRVNVNQLQKASA